MHMKVGCRWRQLQVGTVFTERLQHSCRVRHVRRPDAQRRGVAVDANFDLCSRLECTA